MAAAILATKLFVPPPPPRAVERPRLIERLDAGLQRKLALVSAPAGSGKTTLVSEWVARCGRPAAWLSLDEGDRDLGRFLAYLIAALQTLPPGDVGSRTAGEGSAPQAAAGGIYARALAALQAPQPASSEAVLTALVNDIAALPQDFFLVLDDYHLLDSRPVDEALAFLLMHLPPQMHLVIATREDPALPLARLRARGQLVELRGAELRFTPEECVRFLNQAMNLDLSAEDIAALEKRTEGWIAGLQLASIALQSIAAQSDASLPGHPDSATFIQAFSGSHHFVLDYLVEEVLRQQPDIVQAFLLRTSILARLCGSLCAAVMDAPGASGQATLEGLVRANLFLVPLDNERRWYRYHHLFGDLLRQRLEQSLAPEEIAGCHRRASQWYERHGDSLEAFRHSMAAGDHGRAAGLAELTWQAMDGAFQSAAWLELAMKLPVDVVRSRPVLSVQVARATMDAGDTVASEAYLKDAEAALAGLYGEILVADDAQFRVLPGMIAVSRAYNAQLQGDLTATVEYSGLALRLIPEDDLFLRAQATVTLEFTYWARGELEAALGSILNWMQSMEQLGNTVFAIASAFAAADLQVGLGRLRDAAGTYLQTLRWADEAGPEAQQVTAHHHLGLALLYHEMGEQAAADLHLEQARELGKQSTLVDWPYRWRIASARLKESSGELEAALALLDEARRVYVKNPVPDARPVETLKANLYIKQGRLDKARDWARRRVLSSDDEISYLGEFEHLVLARMLVAEYPFSGDKSLLTRASGLLERLLECAEAQARMGSVIEILAALALAYQAQGQTALARERLGRALDLARPEGYLRLFVDQGEPVRSLLLDYRSWVERQPRGQSGPSLDYLDKLTRAFEAPVDRPTRSGSVSAGLIEPLSERELEVLGLVAQGLSNTEISQRLVLALSTVKGHNLRIFAKLQVQNRTEAVARARQLGLL